MDIDVRQQPRMGIARTFSLTINGIRYRLFRSAVTVGVIAVAIAFMMNVLSESLVKSTVAQETNTRAAGTRKASSWASRLTNPGSLGEVVAAVAAAEPGGEAYLEAQRMGGLSPEEMGTFHRRAKTASTYLAFFRDLEYAPKRVLVRNASGTQILDVLTDEKEFAAFERALKPMRAVRLVTETQEFKKSLLEWPATKQAARKVRQGREAGIRKVRRVLGDRTIVQGLADVEGDFGRAIREAGFGFAESEAALVASQARDIIDERKLEETVSKSEARKAVAAHLDILPAEVNMGVVWQLFGNRRTTDWYFQELEKRGVPVPELHGVTDHASRVTRAYELATKRAEKLAMAKAERHSGDVGGGLMNMGERMTWLLFASMVVCVVGVTNAMLMSVTERFREIATLKCLGAMDDFIMLMFVFEASILGLAGGVIGAMAGGFIGVGRMFVIFGTYLVPLIPLGRLSAAVVLSVVVGMVLASMGAVYPSLKAARLAPMEAMRIQ